MYSVASIESLAFPDSLTDQDYQERLEFALGLSSELGVPADTRDTTVDLLEELRKHHEVTAQESVQPLPLALAVVDVYGAFYELPQETVQSLKADVWAATLLHDIGKVAVPKELLAKSDLGLEWTDDDRRVMSIHSSAGYSIVQSRGLPFGVCRAVAEHHGMQYGSLCYGLNPVLTPSERITRDAIAVADFTDAALGRQNSRNRGKSAQEVRSEIGTDVRLVFSDYQASEDFSSAVLAHIGLLGSVY